jgi:nitrite reductase/ring-hydroxylating ferredoxin subunit
MSIQATMPTEHAATLTLLCGLDEVDEDVPVRAEIDGFAYAVFKVGDMIFVTADMCSHGPGLLSDGYVDGFEIECPFHQGRFDLRTGVPTEPPCEVPVRTWKAIVRDGGIYIDRDAHDPL